MGQAPGIKRKETPPISTVANPNSDGVFPGEPSPTGLTLEEVEEILAQEYRPLTPWVATKLRFQYGVRDLPDPSVPGQKWQIVAPIAEELVHDTIVDLWIKTKEKKVEIKNKTHLRRWLMRALKISLLRWAQHDAREYERRVFSVPIKDEEHDPECSEVTEPWDRQDKYALWWKEELFDSLRDKSDSPLDHSQQKQVPSDELNAAMKHLPGDIRKVVNQVYRENVCWQEASASLNIESRMLQREVQRWLRAQRPNIPSYQPSQQPAREDARRVRKSFHCPVCETKVKRKKGQSGAVCSGCGIGIHKDQFAIQYSYRHA